MKCSMCKKPIIDNHFITHFITYFKKTKFKKTKKYYYHLDECWWKAKMFYSVIVPSIFTVASLFGFVILFLELALEGIL